MREKILKEVAKAYVRLLKRIDWNDEVLVQGLREGLRKFPSNAYIYVGCKLFGCPHKYHLGDYYSRDALIAVKTTPPSKLRGLVFEHMVPKQSDIQEQCELWARERTITEAKVLELLMDKWWIAVVTKEQNSALPKKGDTKDHRARYKKEWHKFGIEPHDGTILWERQKTGRRKSDK